MRGNLSAALAREVTSVYFESPHRVIRSLEVIGKEDPTRLICVARELTKHFEEYRRGDVTTRPFALRSPSAKRRNHPGDGGKGAQKFRRQNGLTRVKI